MSEAKRARKRKAGGYAEGGTPEGGKPEGRKGDGRTEEKCAPFRVIARKPASMMNEVFLAYEGRIEEVLKDKKGQALFALVRVSDGTLQAEVSTQIRECMRRLVRHGLTDEAQELAAAFKRLKELPADVSSLVYRDELDASARLSIAFIIRSLQQGLGRSLQEIELLEAKMMESPLDDMNAENDFKKLRADLKRRLDAALDAVLHPSLSPAKMKSDAPAFRVPWGLFGLVQSMHPSLPAIVHARRFVQKSRRLPTKKELRQILEKEYMKDIGAWKQLNQKHTVADSTWSGIWRRAGLAGLNRDSSKATSAKLGPKR